MSPTSFIVFADDWGRHPSSCQHLFRRLIPRHRTYWVNTIGLRRPTFDLAGRRSHSEMCAGCIVSCNTPSTSALRLPRSTSCLSRALKASSVLVASYLRR